MNKDPSGSEIKTYLWGLQVDALSYIEALGMERYPGWKEYLCIINVPASLTTYIALFSNNCCVHGCKKAITPNNAYSQEFETNQLHQ